MAYRPMGFQRGSKGITGNGDASRVWKGEMVEQLGYWALPFEVPFLLACNSQFLERKEVK
jgi:hypothetical protein